MFCFDVQGPGIPTDSWDVSLVSHFRISTQASPLLASVFAKFADALSLVTWWDITEELVYQFFDVVLGEATECLRVMSHDLPLFPTVTWSCVLHGLHAETTASPPSLSLSPFKIPMGRPTCLYGCWCPSVVLEPSALHTNWDVLSRSLRSWLGTPALRFYLYSPEPPTVLLDFLNSQPFLYGISAERVTSSLRASCLFQERLGDAVVWPWCLARTPGLTGITPHQRLHLQPVVRASGDVVLTPPVIHRLDCGVHAASCRLTPPKLGVI